MNLVPGRRRRARRSASAATGPAGTDQNTPTQQGRFARRALAATLAATLMTGGLLAVDQGPAQAATTPTLTISPSSGTDISTATFSLTSTGINCPSFPDELFAQVWQGAVDAPVDLSAVNSPSQLSYVAATTSLGSGGKELAGATLRSNQDWFNLNQLPDESSLGAMANALGTGIWTIGAVCETTDASPLPTQPDDPTKSLSATAFLDIHADGSWAVVDTPVSTDTVDGTATSVVGVPPGDGTADLTATVSDTSSSGATPSGTVNFFTTSRQLGQPPIDTLLNTTPVPVGADGTAQFTTAAGAIVGTRNVVAEFTPTDPTAFTASVGFATIDVPLGMTTSLVLSPDPTTTAVAPGTPITATATATAASSAAGSPAGTLTLFDGNQQVGDPVTGKPSGLSTSATFTFTPHAGNHALSAEFTPADATKLSLADSTPIDFTVQPGTLTTANPTITGTAKLGSTLTANPGSWGPGTVTLKYAWQANGVAITGATGKTFTLTAAQVGKTITVTVTGSEQDFATASETASTAKVAAGALTAATPTITGTAKVGARLIAKAGTWGPAPVTLRYQWLANGAAITGATGTGLTLTAAQAGKTISVRVSGTKTGYTAGAKTSKATAKVAPGTLAAGTPTITGTAKVGMRLTAKPGTWGPAPVTLKYQWLAGGAAIKGATKATLTLTAAQAGKAISVRVSGSKAGYTAGSKTSKATAKVALRALVTHVPTIAGTARVGKTLTARPGTWTKGAKFSYQWFAAGKAIKGATRASFKLSKAQRGKAISVKVTGRLAGYTTVTKASRATAKVK